MFGPRGAGASRSSDDLHNEDSDLVANEFGRYAVCDGRGSAPAGEVAADLAVDAVKEDLAYRIRDGRRVPLTTDPEWTSPRLIASRIVAAAHRHDPSVDATVVVVRIRQDVDFGWAREIDPSPPETLTRARTLRRSGRPSQRPDSFQSSFGRVSDLPFDRSSSETRRSSVSASKPAMDA